MISWYSFTSPSPARTVREVAVDVDGLAIGTSDRILRILAGNTFGLLLEARDRLVAPPVPKTTPLIVLRSSVVERV